jgi:hypothetical protein
LDREYDAVFYVVTARDMTGRDGAGDGNRWAASAKSVLRM